MFIVKSKTLLAHRKRQRAVAAQQAGRQIDVEALYCQVLSIDTTQFPALFMLGMLYAQAGRYAQAERQFSKALQMTKHRYS